MNDFVPSIGSNTHVHSCSLAPSSMPCSSPKMACSGNRSFTIKHGRLGALSAIVTGDASFLSSISSLVRKYFVVISPAASTVVRQRDVLGTDAAPSRRTGTGAAEDLSAHEGRRLIPRPEATGAGATRAAAWNVVRRVSLDPKPSDGGVGVSRPRRCRRSSRRGRRVLPQCRRDVLLFRAVTKAGLKEHTSHTVWPLRVRASRSSGGKAAGGCPHAARSFARRSRALARRRTRTRPSVDPSKLVCFSGVGPIRTPTGWRRSQGHRGGHKVGGHGDSPRRRPRAHAGSCKVRHGAGTRRTTRERADAPTARPTRYAAFPVLPGRRSRYQGREGQVSSPV